ncbi:MAG: hypothetical protein IJN80_04600 [Clostridia bacterium]|nr:hypothetical protein [Clostridia bacterium]
MNTSVSGSSILQNGKLIGAVTPVLFDRIQIPDRQSNSISMIQKWQRDL